jgi:hypothetical protein
MPKLRSLALVDPGSIPEPARPVGPHGRAVWNRVMSAYAIEDVGGTEILLLIAQSIDRAERCREAIDRDGEMVRGADGVMRRNPLLRDELTNRAFAMRAIDRLGINKEAIKPMGRPPTSVGWRPPPDADE